MSSNEENRCKSKNQIEEEKLWSLIEDLRKKNWQKAPEDVLLKIAYEKKIIKNFTTSFDQLNQEDKQNLKFIMSRMNMVDVHLL